jgi:hypothetical protein
VLAGTPFGRRTGPEAGVTEQNDRMSDGAGVPLEPRGRGILATLKRDGLSQLSMVDFCYDADVTLSAVAVYGYS